MPKNHAKSNQQLTVPQHFHRQEGSSKWYVRLVPPTHLKGFPGVKEYRKSTGHADLRRAKPVGQTLIAEKLREWDALARATQANEATPTILTQELIDIICAARLYSWMRNDDEERLDEKPEPARPKHSGGNKQPSGHNVQQLRHLKTLATKRIVPIHPKLLELGLEDFIAARRKDGPNALLFPSSMPNKDSENPKLGRAYEQAFLRFVRDHLGFGSGYGSHSFRHQLEDRLRNTQADNGSWPAGMSQQYTGRKRTREAGRKVTEEEGSEAAYGNGYIPQSMLRYISQIGFSDITLPKPFYTWLPSGR
ncbi:hypothetical protein [Eoetvoesiella caeni]